MNIATISKNLLSIGEMARRLGVHLQTLRRWSRNGSFTEASRTVGGHRRYQIDAPTSGASGACVGYARVSSHDQKNDLDK